ncbi:MAG: hypothetical protein ACK5YW_10110 [Betaproteobacteria bacterium]|jgi:hypothetical protein|nr:hypothetical protein [Rhodocyclaceae bacterium]MCA3136052.1 hypothetical protein [Rhodocyclaceae bacterium]MCA3141026.1 hypothetical protein [Rhodocyclaceae bacterium]MCA3146178.1 hypothetical protein [Rhodocyclaceae bacterium]MCE2899558.1 hypothetical protein [Betaproteobacteria bacterium]
MRNAGFVVIAGLLAGCAGAPAIPVGADMKPPGEAGGLRAGFTSIATLPAVSESRAALEGAELNSYEVYVHSVQRSVDEGSITPAEGRALIQRQRRQMEWQARVTNAAYSYPDN